MNYCLSYNASNRDHPSEDIIIIIMPVGLYLCPINAILIILTCKITMLTRDYNLFACQNDNAVCRHKQITCERNYVIC